MKIVGFTIAKNCNKYNYPIAANIAQNQFFLDTHIIGVPSEQQDTDNTTQTIIDECNKCQIPFYFCTDSISKPQFLKDKDGFTTSVGIMRLNWPNDNTAWSIESQDKLLQQEMLDRLNLSEVQWMVKQDVDEFYNEFDAQYLKELMELYLDSDINAIAHNYLQFMGSLEFTVFDPTTYVCHIFKPGKAKFSGNDAMQFMTTEGSTAYISDVYLFHIGYVKDPELITTRIREHLVLNASMYPDAVKNADKWKDYKFEFPKHKKGAKLWPIGISSAANETEYTRFDTLKLPSVLRKEVVNMRYYTPDLS